MSVTGYNKKCSDIQVCSPRRFPVICSKDHFVLRVDDEIFVVSHDIWYTGIPLSICEIYRTPRATYSETIDIGTTPDEPIRHGEHMFFSGPCSRVFNTFEYIYQSTGDVQKVRRSCICSHTFRNKSLGRYGNFPHCSARSNSSFVNSSCVLSLPDRFAVWGFSVKTLYATSRIRAVGSCSMAAVTDLFVVASWYMASDGIVLEMRVSTEEYGSGER
jgi:hypothetical protein